MVTLETIRSAVLSDVPWQKMDELVRAEIAAGRRVREIAADLSALAEDVWNIAGLTEDGQDAFGDAYDALIGNCRRDQCYNDPPELAERNGAAHPPPAHVPSHD